MANIEPMLELLQERQAKDNAVWTTQPREMPMPMDEAQEYLPGKEKEVRSLIRKVQMALSEYSDVTWRHE